MLRVVVACWCALLLACAGRGMRPESLPKFDSVEEQFKYGSVGIESEEGIPYWIWQVLPRVFADKLPRPGGYAAFGFLWEPGKELPVGFSKVDLYGGPRVAINCAFCHTASVRTSELEPPRLIAAGPGNQINPQAYVKFLQAVADDPRFDSGELLDAIGGLTQLSWRQRMQYRYLLIPAAKRALQKQRQDYDWMYRNPGVGTGPHRSLQPGQVRHPEAAGGSDHRQLGHGADLEHEGAAGDVAPLGRAERVAARSRAQQRARRRREPQVDPAAEPCPHRAVADGRPAAGRIRTTSTRRSPAKGARVYDQQCAQCHAPGGTRTGTVVPVEEVGTDRHRLDMWTPAAPVAYNKYTDGYAYDFTGFRKTNGYVAVPLDGVWLRAPYLHNGSVPSLQELFEPAAGAAPDLLSRLRRLRSRSRRLRLRRRQRQAHGHAVRHAPARQQQRRPPLRRRAHAGAEEGAHRVFEDAVAAALS